MGIKAQRLRIIRRLRKEGTELSNADRGMLGALAVAGFTGATDAARVTVGDPETMLADLLADLMHWCDVQNSKREQDAIEFSSALERARDYYEEEVHEGLENGSIEK